MYKLVQVLTGIDLPCEVRVGRNLVIDHFGSMVISGYAMFGDNCACRAVKLDRRRRAGGGQAEKGPAPSTGPVATGEMLEHVCPATELTLQTQLQRPGEPGLRIPPAKDDRFVAAGTSARPPEIRTAHGLQCYGTPIYDACTHRGFYPVSTDGLIKAENS